MLKRIATYHALTLFYSNPEAFNRFMGKGKQELEIDEKDYQALLFGTDANIFVPLWASASKGGEKTWMNQDTLQIMEIYKKYGYEPELIFGNPPDYIGEQLRFLEQLAAWTMKGVVGKEEGEEGIRSFTKNYLIDSIRPTAEAIRQHNMESLNEVASIIDGLIEEEWFEFGIEEKTVRRWEAWRRNKGETPVLDEMIKIEKISLSNIPCKGIRYPFVREGSRGESKYKVASTQEAVNRVSEAFKWSNKTYGPNSRVILSKEDSPAYNLLQELEKHFEDVKGAASADTPKVVIALDSHGLSSEETKSIIPDLKDDTKVEFIALFEEENKDSLGLADLILPLPSVIEKRMVSPLFGRRSQEIWIKDIALELGVKL